MPVFHSSTTSGQSVNWHCHGTERPANTHMCTRMHTRARSAAQALLTSTPFLVLFLTFLCVQALAVWAEVKLQVKTVFMPNLGKAKHTYFSPSSQQYRKGDFPFLFIYCSSKRGAWALSGQEGGANSALSSDMASQMAKSTVKQQKNQLKPTRPILLFPKEGLFHVL